MKKLLGTLLAVFMGLLLLCSCTTKTSNSASSLPDSRDEMALAGVDARYSAISSQTVEHGEDYVIQWEDPAMEAHVRFVLDKPEGDILHSDVWNIQVIVLRASSADGFDVALEQPTSGDTFTFEMVETNPEVTAFVQWDRLSEPVRTERPEAFRQLTVFFVQRFAAV